MCMVSSKNKFLYQKCLYCDSAIKFYMSIKIKKRMKAAAGAIDNGDHTRNLPNEDE